MSSASSISSVNSWPTIVRNQSWPSSGIKYSYQNRYIKPEKLELWLNRAFGHNGGKYVIYNGYFYINAPRKPNYAELDWLMDSDRNATVLVPEYGYLTMS